MDGHSIESNGPAFVLTDAGRIAGETRDCTVRALALACGVPYERAHAVCKLHGRSSRKGLNFKAVAAKAIKELGLECRQVRRSGSLASLLRDYPTGTIIVRKHGHAFAVINGVIHDTFNQSPKCHIKGAWLLS